MSSEKPRSSSGGLLTAVASVPWRDTWSGLERCLAHGYPGLAKIAVGLVIGWWIYVPVHELLHALGCIAAGGTVSRLEIDALYGGYLFAALFSFVVPHSEYAGRLSGFDTGGSDLVYLATDLAPFLLTLFPGVWLLRRAGRRGRPLIFGAALPLALAPFLSLTGDAYEIGSILTTHTGPWASQQTELRGDDLLLQVTRLADMGSAAPWGGFVLSVALGVLWAFATYAAGAGLASIGETAREDGKPPERSEKLNRNGR